MTMLLLLNFTTTLHDTVYEIVQVFCVHEYDLLRIVVINHHAS